MGKFWKGRLRKGISIVAAMVLSLSSVMPTVPVFAAEPLGADYTISDSDFSGGSYSVNPGGYSVIVKDQSESYEEYVRTHTEELTFGVNWKIVDHRNFQGSNDSWLVQYYQINSPAEDGDGTGWDETHPVDPTRFPWLVINYNAFDGNKAIRVFYDNVLNDFYWKPTAKVGDDEDRTYGIISVPGDDDLGMSEFVESREGTENFVDTSKLEVRIGEHQDKADWLSSLSTHVVKFQDSSEAVELTFEKVNGKIVLKTPGNATKEEYVCNGWETGGYTFGEPITNDITLVANCTPAAVEYTATNGNVTYYDSIPSAFSSNGTYKLLKDVTRTTRMTPGTFASNVILDLNGYTLTSTASDYAILLGRNGSASSHKTFDIVDTSTNKGGKIIYTTAHATNNGLISVSGKYNDVTIGEGVTLQGGGISVFGDNNKLDVYGTVNGGDDFAVAVNGANTINAIINIHEGAVLTSNETAVYLPGKDNLTAVIDGKVTGKTAVEIRAGTLTIGENAELTATGEFSEAENGDGTTVNGAALAVSQHTTNLPIDVTINGGKFVGSKALYEKDLEDTTVDNINMAVIDGEFDGVVYSQNVERFIVGGTYSSDPSAYVVSGKQAIQEGGVWTISDYTPNPDGSINCSADSVVAELENSANPGVKTCYISISDAVDAAPKNSTTTSTITVKEGTYTDYNNVQVEWSRNIVMKGEEGKTVVFKHTTTATDQYAMVVVGQGSIRFENITFELIQGGSSHTHWIGVAQGSAPTIKLKNCTIKGTLYINYDIDFEDCTFVQHEDMTNQNTYNIQILGGTVKIIDSTITNKGGRPINIYADNCENVRNITVENTTITNLGAADRSALDIKETNGNGSCVLTNTIYIKNVNLVGDFPETYIGNTGYYDIYYVINELNADGTIKSKINSTGSVLSAGTQNGGDTKVYLNDYDTPAYSTPVYTTINITYTGLKGGSENPDENPITHIVRSPAVDLLDATDGEGYIFSGWYVGDDKVEIIDDTYVTDVELTAKYECGPAVDTEGFELEECPAGGICEESAGYELNGNTCTAVTGYKLSSCTGGYTLEGGTCVINTQEDVEELLVPDPGTTVSAGSIADLSLANAEAIDTGFDANDYSGVTTPQIIIQQKIDSAALKEEGTTESALENALTTDFVADSGKVADMQGILDIKLIYLDGLGNATPLGKVTFSDPVKIMIPVKTGSNVQVRVKHEGDSSYGTDGLTLDSNVTCNPDGTVDDSDAYTGGEVPVVNGKAEIYTCSASSFVAYIETTPAPTPSNGGGSGGGGGGGSSYSCKNLPDNAVANNKSTPKSNTNYSYSTDTGAVCTFQCKAGYTRNEETSKCEKSEGTVADTEKVDSDTSDTANTDNTITIGDLQKVLDDGYTLEFHNAYNFAFKHGITTMPDIESANMNSPLTRIAMAKMLSQYAINVLGKKPANVIVPDFPDVSDELDAQYNYGVTLAYQLGIMGININEFRPFDTVTRAEFATALSRMLFGLADGENLYYETHMQKLLDEKIITVATPDMQELRGYVMIMLMRSASK